LASENNAGAFLQLATAEIDGAFETMKRRMGWAIYGDGSGAIGSIQAEPAEAATTVVLFNNVEDIVKIEVGQTLEARNGATTRVFATGAATALVTKVDRDAGTITLGAVDNSGNTDTIVAGDTLNVVGDYNAKVSGLAAWIPSSAPSNTAFFGVDRTIDSTRLGGIRVASSGKPIEEALIDGARRVGREGLGSPKHVFCGFSKYASLEKSLGLNFSPDGIVFDRSLWRIFGPVSSTIWDWMHCLVASGGAGQYAVNGFCLHVRQHGVSLEDLDKFASTLRGGNRKFSAPLKKTWFQDRVVTDTPSQAHHVKGFAGECLTAVAVLSYHMLSAISHDPLPPVLRLVVALLIAPVTLILIHLRLALLRIIHPPPLHRRPHPWAERGTARELIFAKLASPTRSPRTRTIASACAPSAGS
jgi:hypothetical protein